MSVLNASSKLNWIRPVWSSFKEFFVHSSHHKIWVMWGEMKKSINTTEASPKLQEKAIRTILFLKLQVTKKNPTQLIHQPWIINQYPHLQLTPHLMILGEEMPSLCVLSIRKMSFRIFVLVATNLSVLSVQFMVHIDNMRCKQLVELFQQLKKGSLKLIRILLCKSVT